MANINHFNLTLDTQAPSGEISASRYYKANAAAADTNALKITYSGTPAYMKVWFDTSAEGSKESEGFAAASWETVAGTHKTEFAKDGDWFYHVVLMDDVGNQSEVADTTIITFDTQVPFVRKNTGTAEAPNYVKGVVINGDALKTKSRDIRVEFWFDDPLKTGSTDGISKVANGTISGNVIGSPIAINPSATEIEAGYAYRDIQFTAEAEDGPQTIKVVVTDNAGNSSEETDLSKDTITLDTTAATGQIILKNAAQTAQLPTWINFTAFTALIDLDNASTDVVGYKLWGDIVGKTTEPTDYTPVTAGTDPIVITDLAFTTGDAVKTVNAKIIDDAGNETELTAVTVKLDQTAPTVSIARDKQYISKVTGFTNVVITPTVNMNPGSQTVYSPCVSWSLKVNGTQVRNGSAESGIVPWTLTATDSMVENQNNTITLTVTDEAQNSTTSESVTVYLDTAAPSVSLPTLNTWYNAQFTVDATTSDAASGVDGVWVWVSTKADDTTVPATCSKVTISSAVQTIAIGEIDWKALAQSKDNYMHAKVVDNVGNIGEVAHAHFGYDDKAPYDTSVSAPAYTNTATINISLVSSDATSSAELGAAYFKIWGDITGPSAGTTGDGPVLEGAATWQEFTGSPMTKSVTLTDGDGVKTIYAKFKDTAGNITETAVSCTTELDTASPTGKLQLYTTSTPEAVVPDHTNQAAFKARFYDMDDNDVTETLQLKYKLYGDFSYDAQSATGIAEADAEWKTVVLDSGTEVMTIANCFFTLGDGSKTINVKFKDNAGNVSTVASQTRVYDTTAPEVVVSDIDYNKISKLHTNRRVNNVEVSGKYNDEVNFAFTPDSLIQAYKVCAYLTQAAAEAVTDPENESPIPITAGSINMSASGLNEQKKFDALIKGADFEVALDNAKPAADRAVEYAVNTAYAVGKVIKNAGTFYTVVAAITAAENTKFDDIKDKLTPGALDGARFVVVYVKDLAGTWSAAADFSV